MNKKKPKLSSNSRTTQLFFDDDLELERRAKITHATPALTIREIVKSFFAAERLKAAGYDQTNRAVREAQSEVVAPLKNQLDATSNNMKEVNQRMEELTQVINLRTANISGQQENNHESVTSLLKTIHKMQFKMQDEQKLMIETILQTLQLQLDLIVQELERQTEYDRQILRNIMTLRGLIYVYLVGFQSGALQTRNMSINAYIKAVQVTAEKFYQKSDQDIMIANSADFDEISKQIANDLMSEMKRISNITNEIPKPS